LEKSGGRGGAYKSRWDGWMDVFVWTRAHARSGSISGASQDFDLLRYGLALHVGWVLCLSVCVPFPWNWSLLFLFFVPVGASDALLHFTIHSIE
jgi:hypothetical protein